MYALRLYYARGDSEVLTYDSADDARDMADFYWTMTEPGKPTTVIATHILPNPMACCLSDIGPLCNHWQPHPNDED